MYPSFEQEEEEEENVPFKDEVAAEVDHDDLFVAWSQKEKE